jgi:hypothetical protein
MDFGELFIIRHESFKIWREFSDFTTLKRKDGIEIVKQEKKQNKFFKHLYKFFFFYNINMQI